MFRIPTCIILGALAASAMAADPQVVELKTLKAQMRYSITEIDVAPGTPLKIVFENEDDMPHNLVICKPGTDVVAMANKQLEHPEDALKRNFLPDDPAIWLHTKLVPPHEKDELTLTAPEQPGNYPFVCTMPGHAMSMKGELRVVAKGKILSGLTFKLYNGEWKNLPDFSKLQPHRQGEVSDNLIQLQFDDYKNNYGVVFNGKLNVPENGEYTFALASDDGSRISIDGKKVVDADGVHPSSEVHEKKVKLNAGDHDFTLEYFQKDGEAEVYAAWAGPKFSMTPLSKWVHPTFNGQPRSKKKDENSGMPLIVEQEPIIYRNFISGAGTRGIGVGYPGGFNIAWSAQSMNVAIVWRGAFIDAARHWTSRGGGFQPPLGYDVFRPAGDLTTPFAIKGDLTWTKVAKDLPAGGYTWKGYRLDAKRFPTFFYEWGGVKVSDRFDTQGDAVTGTGKLIRTLTLQGPIPAGALYHVASGTIQPAGAAFAVEAGKLSLDGHDFEDKFIVESEGATIEGNDLVVPAKSQIKITYSWPMEHLHTHAQ